MGYLPCDCQQHRQQWCGEHWQSGPDQSVKSGTFNMTSMPETTDSDPRLSAVIKLEGCQQKCQQLARASSDRVGRDYC